MRSRTETQAKAEHEEQVFWVPSMSRWSKREIFIKQSLGKATPRKLFDPPANLTDKFGNRVRAMQRLEPWTHLLVAYR